MERRKQSLFDRATIVPALIASLAKLDPRVQWHIPVKFVDEVGAVMTSVGRL